MMRMSNLPCVFYLLSMVCRFVDWNGRTDEYEEVSWDLMYDMEYKWARIFDLWEQIQAISTLEPVAHSAVILDASRH